MASIRSSVISVIPGGDPTKAVASAEEQRFCRSPALAHQTRRLGNGKVVQHDEGEHCALIRRERPKDLADHRSILEAEPGPQVFLELDLPNFHPHLPASVPLDRSNMIC